MDCTPPGSSVHGILQARILEWVAFPLSRGSSPPSDPTPGLLHCRRILYQLSHQGIPINNKGTFERERERKREREREGERERERERDSKQKINTPNPFYCLPKIIPEKQSHRLLCSHCGVRTPKTTVEEGAAWILPTF